MRLPWVSRAAYEREKFEADAWKGAFDRMYTQWQQTCNARDVLIDKIIAMKRDGFTAPVTEPTVAFQQQADDLPNPVLDALDEIGLTGAQLEQHKDWARRRLRREKNAEIVAEELLAGGLVMEEPEA